jgi:hypothetical protein
LARQLDAGWAGADDCEPQPVFALLGLQLRHLERAKDPTAQLERVIDRLHPGRVGRELIVAEVGLSRASRNDQAVIGHHRAPPACIQPQLARAKVNIDDLAQQHPRVLVAVQNISNRRRDRAH